MERWKVNLYSVWFSQILSMMSFNFGTPFLSFYIQELGIAEPDKIKLYTGILSIVPAVSLAVMAPIWGIAADKWGKKLMLLRAMFFASFIIAGMGLVTNANQLVGLRLAQGIFTGTITAAAALVASGTPSNRLSFAMGFMSSSTFIGASAGPAIGGFMAECMGYRNSFYIGCVLMMADFFLVLFFIKEEKEVLALPKEKIKLNIPKVSLFSFTVVVMLLVIFILRFSRSIFTPYLPLFVQEKLSGKGGAATITGLINGVTGFMTALAGLTLGRIGDRYSKRALLKIFFITGAVLSIPLVFSTNLLIFTIIYGLFFYVIGAIEPVAISAATEVTPRERHGVLFGIQAMVGNMGWAVSPMLASVISIKYSIQAILVVIPISLLPGLVTVFITNRKKQTAV